MTGERSPGDKYTWEEVSFNMYIPISTPKGGAPIQWLQFVSEMKA